MIINYIQIILFLTIIPLFFIIPSAYAISAGDEYTPTQPNAFASYNNSTNQVQVSWDFDTLPVDTRCFLKLDFVFNEDMNDGTVHTKVPSFIPRFYSVITSTPVLLDAVNDRNNNQHTEEVLCSGETRIDIDTMMSHSENTENYPDFEAFLTFYVPDSNGNFNTSLIHTDLKIDEVSISYNSNAVFDQATKDYICDGQIGSALHIDQSGSGGTTIAHGNNGDNCSQYLYIENNQYVDIGMTGIITKGYHLSNHPLLIENSSFINDIKEDVQSNDTKNKKGSGCSGDCESPTFGKSKSLKPIVKDGLTLNGNSFDVDSFYTPMDMQHTNVLDVNRVDFKIYENYGVYNIDYVQFGTVKEIGSSSNDAEFLIEIDVAHFANDIENPTFDSFTVIDDDNLIQNVNVELSITECGYVNSECLMGSITWQYRESPIHKVLLLEAWDNSKNTNKVYFNHGITVNGDSLNNPPTDKIFQKTSSQDKGIWLELIKTDKVNDIWTDQNNIEYQKLNDQYVRITPLPEYSCNDLSLDKVNVPTRNNCHFRENLTMYNQQLQ